MVYPSFFQDKNIHTRFHIGDELSIPQINELMIHLTDEDENIHFIELPSDPIENYSEWVSYQIGRRLGSIQDNQKLMTMIRVGEQGQEPAHWALIYIYKLAGDNYDLHCYDPSAIDENIDDYPKNGSVDFCINKIQRPLENEGFELWVQPDSKKELLNKTQAPFHIVCHLNDILDNNDIKSDIALEKVFAQKQLDAIFIKNELPQGVQIFIKDYNKMSDDKKETFIKKQTSQYYNELIKAIDAAIQENPTMIQNIDDCRSLQELAYEIVCDSDIETFFKRFGKDYERYQQEKHEAYLHRYDELTIKNDDGEVLYDFSDQMAMSPDLTLDRFAFLDQEYDDEDKIAWMDTLIDQFTQKKYIWSEQFLEKHLTSEEKNILNKMKIFLDEYKIPDLKSEEKVDCWNNLVYKISDQKQFRASDLLFEIAKIENTADEFLGELPPPISGLSMRLKTQSQGHLLINRYKHNPNDSLYDVVKYHLEHEKIGYFHEIRMKKNIDYARTKNAYIIYPNFSNEIKNKVPKNKRLKVTINAKDVKAQWPDIHTVEDCNEDYFIRILHKIFTAILEPAKAAGFPSSHFPLYYSGHQDVKEKVERMFRKYAKDNYGIYVSDQAEQLPREPEKEKNLKLGAKMRAEQGEEQEEKHKGPRAGFNLKNNNKFK